MNVHIDVYIIITIAIYEQFPMLLTANRPLLNSKYNCPYTYIIDIIKNIIFDCRVVASHLKTIN